MDRQTFLTDLLERAAASFAQGFIAVLLTGGALGRIAETGELSDLRSAGLAAAAGGLAAALSVVKSLLARRYAGSGSASMSKRV